jgi:hypothetical protein
MAAYGYTCPACGPFDLDRPIGLASAAPVGCPVCGLQSERAYFAPGGRGPRRARQVDGAGRATLGRIDRSEQGIPSVGARPAGRRMHGGVPAPLAHPKHAGRPWQLGH